MALRDVRRGQLLRTHLDGLPLDPASCLLPPGLVPGLVPNPEEW